MAVSEIKNPSSLKIKLSLGLVDGKAKTRSKSYSYLKHDANLQDVYDVVEQMRKLEEYNKEVEEKCPWVPSNFNKNRF